MYYGLLGNAYFFKKKSYYAISVIQFWLKFSYSPIVSPNLEFGFYNFKTLNLVIVIFRYIEDGLYCMSTVSNLLVVHT